MEQLQIEINIDIETMKIKALHNFQELLEYEPENLAFVYNRILSGLCRTFGGIIYALLEPKKNTVHFFEDKEKVLSIISKTIDHDLWNDLDKEGRS